MSDPPRLPVKRYDTLALWALGGPQLEAKCKGIGRGERGRERERANDGDAMRMKWEMEHGSEEG